MGRFSLTLPVSVFLALAPAHAQQNAPAPAPSQAQQKKADNYAGTVSEFSSDKVVVAKTKESRTFKITPETKIEGKLKAKVRVTVRYVADDDGYTALRIIVRTSTPKAK
jgi:hypothetical protein